MPYLSSPALLDSNTLWINADWWGLLIEVDLRGTCVAVVVVVLHHHPLFVVSDFCDDTRACEGDLTFEEWKFIAVFVSSAIGTLLILALIYFVIQRLPSTATHTD
jgi:hypothetical protein